MNCNNCMAEWTPPANVSISNCPFCGKPLFDSSKLKKESEPHEVLVEIVERFNISILGHNKLGSIIKDLMPHVEKKYHRIFTQAVTDNIGFKILELKELDSSIQNIKLETLRHSFKNNNGFNNTADYVVDCFLFAIGIIEKINKEQYQQNNADNLSIINQQIDMALADGVLQKEESKTLFSNSQKLGLIDNVVVDLINAKIKSLKLVPNPPTLKYIKNKKEIICSSDWIVETRNTKDKSSSGSNGTIVQKQTYPSGEVYEGEFKNGKHNGKGIMIFPDGSKYEGDWIDNEFNGKGIMIYRRGSIYEGEWKSNKRNGNGKFTNPNGDAYEGEWKNNKKHGQGIMIFPDGTKHEGEYKNDNKHGQGIMIYSDGSKYEGDWMDNEYNGKGVMIDSDGSKYEGVYKNNNKHGQGIMIYSNGYVYRGEFKNGKRNGKGIMIRDGCKYEGAWIDNELNGKGIIIYSDGTKYEGEFKNGKRNGKGIMIYSDGTKYEGDWINNLRNGNGKFTHTNGDAYEGEWMNNNKHGQGIMIYSDGSKYEGVWKSNKRNGKGKFTDSTTDNSIPTQLNFLSIKINTEKSQLLFSKGAKIPSTKTISINIPTELKRELIVELYQGEEVEDTKNKLVGKFSVDFIIYSIVSGGLHSQRVPRADLKFKIDKHGVISLEAEYKPLERKLEVKQWYMS